MVKNKSNRLSSIITSAYDDGCAKTLVNVFALMSTAIATGFVMWALVVMVVEATMFIVTKVFGAEF